MTIFVSWPPTALELGHVGLYIHTCAHSNSIPLDIMDMGWDGMGWELLKVPTFTIRIVWECDRMRLLFFLIFILLDW